MIHVGMFLRQEGGEWRDCSEYLRFMDATPELHLTQLMHEVKVSEQEDVNSLTVSDMGDDVSLTLDPSLLDFSFPYIPTSSELYPINPLEIDQQLDQHLVPLPTFLDHDLDSENQLVLSGDGFIDRTAWLSTGSDLQQLHSARPNVSSSTMADGTSATEPGVSAEESEPTNISQPKIPSSARTGLPRRRSRYLIRRQDQQSGPIVIPNANAMGPMERWHPSAAHLDQHNHNVCHGDSGKPRSFRRKDHLVQHLRLMHNIDTLPLIDDWKISHSAVPSRCGFCEHSMDTWEQRVDHLAEHFRKNATMKDWKGDHGFPPSIAAQVTNSLPPYLIAEESQSLIPFSATNTHVQDHFVQISSRAHYLTEEQKASPDKVAEDAQAEAAAKPNISMSELSSFTQVLTLHLSHYAQEKIKQGVMPTDDMFQQEARRVLYDSEDSWNQTIADNPEWLSAFRHLHCGERNNIEPRSGGVESVDHHLEDIPQSVQTILRTYLFSLFPFRCIRHVRVTNCSFPSAVLQIPKKFVDLASVTWISDPNNHKL
ncbi:hypothetical protein ANOM_000656 [Aspergillus nomiae NRRL 13137]|uniref:C2H2-type domain-containing protein n=1 Tax=Aspergillus nomiae NRRL (strain ATCC 15546 / NRRL 13137 / CBS 260.88 / M93) TaxID=1509407 RepID=A0A0L1JGR8_ASPN3|nr:uncharacterized protein ANOM_000656 [Aspergillus nomiae NRRL 13137]KNG90941.1 hypothetical protein ANOM_000656 [Aspergillus nomiae NRRL 13137]